MNEYARRAQERKDNIGKTVTCADGNRYYLVCPCGMHPGRGHDAKPLPPLIELETGTPKSDPFGTQPMDVLL